MKPEFCPKDPVSQLRGRKTVAMIVSCFITELKRFETVERLTSIAPVRRSR
jgi:hypothetical protein